MCYVVQTVKHSFMLVALFADLCLLPALLAMADRKDKALEQQHDS